MAGPRSALFGYCLDILLYGILTVQTYLYYLAFPRDRWQVKSIVYFVYVVGTIQTAFALRDFYALFCTSARVNENPATLQPNFHVFGFMWFTIPVSSTLVAIIAQLFYAYRIHTLSRRKLVTAIVSMLAVSQFTCGIYSAATTFNRKLYTSNILLVSAMVWGLVGLICDIVIAAYMFHFLSKQLVGVPRRTQVPLTKTKRLLLETGILTAAMATAYVVLTLTFSPSLFVIAGLSLSKVYGNSILVLLNNRFTIPGGRNTPHPDFDIVSYSCSDGIGGSQGPVVSGTVFTHTHPAETTTNDHSRGIHTVNPAPSFGQV